MAWSADQERAVTAVKAWRRDPSRQVFRLFGYAGTGKSTLAKSLAEDEDVAFAAFTGKAALVMQSKGCYGASTIHSLIYKTEQDPVTGVCRYRLNKDSPVKDCAFVIIDECSMVDEELGRDLLSFGKQVLVLGDPAQLPPVKGAGFFTDGNPDAMLTEVHRQAQDNPIIRLSMQVRKGERLDYGDHGACRVIARDDVDGDLVMSAEQVLVGLNRTRTLYNKRMRALKGLTTVEPTNGERLICLRNNRTKGLLNGGIWSVAEVLFAQADGIDMVLTPMDSGLHNQVAEVTVHQFFFQGREGELDWRKRRESDEFDFGYAVTVHKAQGSQWDDVMLFDESFAFRDDRQRWLYTGITRAAKTVTVVR